MKNLLFLLLCLLVITVSCNKKPAEPPAVLHDHAMMMQTDSNMRDGVFIHITEGYNDPHRVLMPLKMANMMAMDKDVLVYLDIKAVELVLKTSKDLEYADFDPLKKQLQGLIDKKVGVYACPTCLKLAGHTPEELMEGIQVANKEAFFNFTNGRIITLDY
jgi:predicted peroxiredoxin